MYIRRLCSRGKFPCPSDGKDYSRTERESVCRALQDVNNNVSQRCWTDDLIRLNRLGVCMSPEATVTMQKKMNGQLKRKVQIWKASMEEDRSALLLAWEVLRKEITAPQLDFSKRSLESATATQLQVIKHWKRYWIKEKTKQSRRSAYRRLFTTSCWNSRKH